MMDEIRHVGLLGFLFVVGTLLAISAMYLHGFIQRSETKYQA